MRLRVRPSWSVIPVCLFAGLACSSPVDDNGGGVGGIFFEEVWDYGDADEARAQSHMVASHKAVMGFEPASEYAPAGKYMRAPYEAFDFPDVTDYTSTVSFNPPNAVTAKPRHIWVEVAVRFADNWRIAAGEGGFTTDDKTFFAIEDHSGIGGGSSEQRWEVHFGIFGPDPVLYGGPGNDFGPPFMSAFPDADPAGWEDIWDGEWSWFRMEYKMSSTASTPDGEWRVGWNDQWLMENTALDSRSPEGAFFNRIWLGANADVAEQSYRDWGVVRIYTEDPNWAMRTNSNQ